MREFSSERVLALGSGASWRDVHKCNCLGEPVGVEAQTTNGATRLDCFYYQVLADPRQNSPSIKALRGFGDELTQGEAGGFV